MSSFTAYDLYYEYIASSVRHNSNSFPPRFMALRSKFIPGSVGSPIRNDAKRATRVLRVPFFGKE
ncbi:hypothetical protein BC936DRAFT_144757 [Jimgerdemannia flammicorona]|uniref:Uncharacterized protein n=1 Tax=Jimgerdemannia flammicorona TaxID=994334 RepID=A0A433DBR9_9FUNG|nr:hypothetical protein BC936DRAFT_144757 [Jimgerdemannia flammicorona]